MSLKEVTIGFRKLSGFMNKQFGIDYCMENKDKILLSGKSEEEFKEIITKLEGYWLASEDLPSVGISDQSLGIIHPRNVQNELFSQSQLEKLERCLHMIWGKTHYSNQNVYQTTLSTYYQDADLEDLVARGFMTKWDLDSSKNRQVNDSTCYFVTEKAIDELKKIWGDFQVLWLKNKE